MIDHTKRQYIGLTEAYAFFNAKLFENRLPTCLITLTRKKGMAGYFHREKFMDMEAKVSELALNPNEFLTGNVPVLDTLLHEMCHVWQFHFGKKCPKGAYHNQEFADKMLSVGLQVSSTGKPGGKTTGNKMSDYPVEGGIFTTLAKEFLDKGEFVLYTEQPDIKRERNKKKKKDSKTKYTCEFCGANAWAKPKTLLICGVDRNIMEAEPNLDEDQESEAA